MAAVGTKFNAPLSAFIGVPSAFIGDSKDFGWHHSQFTQSADELGFGDEDAVDGAGGEELGDAAAAAALLHLDAQLVAGDHGALEARAVDADEVVDPLAVVLLAEAA